MSELLDQVRQTRQTIEKNYGDLSARVRELELGPQRPGGSFPGAGGESPGAKFVKSPQFRDMIDRNDASSGPAEIGTFRKALVSTPASGGALVDPQRVQELIYPPQRASIIRDLFSVQPAQNNSVEYVQESGFTDAAAIVPEGDLKPESDMTFELVTSPVRTIATVITASRQILDDSSQLESHINQRLAYAVGLAEERQVLYGTGIAPNLQGVMTHPRRQQYTQVAADSKIDAIRKGMTLGRIAEYPIDGLVIHPSDWESIELTKDADGRYIFISAPSEGGAGTFWRLRVVDSTAIQPGTALVGAFGMGGSIFDRQTASVRISESHADYFQRNLVLLRGESRLTVCWYRPEAFVEVVFTAPAA